MERILRERAQARDALKAVQPELEAYRQLRGYLDNAQLNHEDVNVLLGVGARLRAGDMEGFLRGVMPYVQMAEEALGLRLPNDLQNQVNQGLIHPDAAAEMGRNRYRIARAEGERQIAETRLRDTQQAREQENQGHLQQSVIDAINNWETGMRSRDPDFAGKADSVMRHARSLILERGYPQTPQAGVAYVEEALRQVNEFTNGLIARVAPPQPTKPTPHGVNGATSPAAFQEPRSMRDAMEIALRRMRA